MNAKHIRSIAASLPFTEGRTVAPNVVDHSLIPTSPLEITMRRLFLVPLIAAIVSVFGSSCTDANPTGIDENRPVANSWAQISNPSIGPVSGYDTIGIAESYLARDPFAPFGANFNYDAFFDDPEMITDEEFECQAPYSIDPAEVDQIEFDMNLVRMYSGGGGGGCEDPNRCGPPEPMGAFDPASGDAISFTFGLTCEQKRDQCWERCRRLPSWSSRRRALCWAGCMASYALCVRRRRGG